MALIELNLKKPALIEEQANELSPRDRRRLQRQRRSSDASDDRNSSSSSSSGGGRGRIVGLLVAVAAVGLAIRRFRSSGSDVEPSQEYEHGAEPDIGDEPVRSDGGSRKLGAVAAALAVAVVAVVARRRGN